MQVIMIVALMVLLFAIIYQDFRYRSIHVFLLLGIFILSITYNSYKWTFALFKWHILFNILFILIELLLVTCVFSLKARKLVNIIDTYLGLGDIFFFAVLACFFSPFSFLVFFIISHIAILITFGIVQVLTKKEITIPLAGGQAICLLLLIAIDVFFNISRF